jgi:hypothetical protein
METKKILGINLKEINLQRLKIIIKLWIRVRGRKKKRRVES